MLVGEFREHPVDRAEMAGAILGEEPGQRVPFCGDSLCLTERLECGLCVSACPITGSDSRYLGPAALTAAWRSVAAPRGADPAEILAWVDDEQGCWRCHASFECTEACPSDADPAAAIMALRGELTRQRLGRIARLGRRGR